MKTYCASFAYTLLQILCLPIIIVLLLVVHAQRRGKDNWHERLGFVPVSPPNKKVIWFHAVSAGEVLSVQEIIATIKREQPESWCYLTVGTPIGRQMAEKNIAADAISYLPYDFLPSMFLAHVRIRPHALIVVESELWPHLFFLAAWRRTLLFLVNARVSQRSAHRMQVLAPLVRLLFNCCHIILTQSDAGRASFLALGVAENKVSTLGNIKAFNVFQKKVQLLVAKQPSVDLVLLAGSIHPTEDGVYLALFCQLKKNFPSLKLIVVPRHFHWQESLIIHTRATGLRTVVWTSDMAEVSIESLLEHADIVIVCRFGELFTLYQHASIFFLGGTFVPVGGHNLLEPAAWGVPSIVGPYHANCLSTLEALEEHQAARAVKSEAELYEVAQDLLKNPAQRIAMQDANRSWIQEEAHRVENTMRLLLFRLLFDY